MDNLPRLYLLFGQECAQNIFNLKQLDIFPVELIRSIIIMYIDSYELNNIQLVSDNEHMLLHNEQLYIWGSASTECHLNPMKFTTKKVKYICDVGKMIATTEGLYGHKSNRYNEIDDTDIRYYKGLTKVDLKETKSGDIISVDSGFHFTVIVTKDNVYSRGSDWPENESPLRGVLGIGDYKTNGLTPIYKSTHDSFCYSLNKINITGGIKVKCGYDHSILLTTHGLYSWGMSDCGGLGLGNITHSSIPVKINLDNVVDIDYGFNYNMAIVYDNLLKKYCLYAWGLNEYGQLGLGNLNDQFIPQRVCIDGSVISISCSPEYVLCLTTTGLYTWGNTITTPIKINIDDVIIINADVLCNSVITKNKTIISWPITNPDTSYIEDYVDILNNLDYNNYIKIETGRIDNFFNDRKENGWEISDEYGFKVCKLTIAEIEKRTK